MRVESRSLESDIFRSADAVAGEVGDWKKLTSRSSLSSLYVDAGWYLAWFEAFGQDLQVRVVSASSADSLEGILPLVYSKVRRRPWFSMHHVQELDTARLADKYLRGNWFPLRQLAPPACIDSGSVRGFGLFGEIDGAGPVQQEMISTLLRDDSWDVLVVPAAEDRVSSSLEETCRQFNLHCVVSRSSFSLFGMIPKPWEAYTASRTRHFRKRMSAAERDLAKLGEIELKTFTTREDLESGMIDLFRLSESSSKSMPRQGQKWWAPLDEGPRSFLRNLVDQYVEDDRPGTGVVLHQVNVGNAPAAVLLSVVVNHKLYAVQTFFEPKYSSGSPGRVLIKHMLCWAEQNDISWVDFNGNSSLVRLFSQDGASYRQAWIFNRTPRARLAYAVFGTIQNIFDAVTLVKSSVESVFAGLRRLR